VRSRPSPRAQMVVAVGASAAAAKAVTLHFFSKQVYSRISTANGKPLTPNAPPTVGDRFSFASNDYVGNHDRRFKVHGDLGPWSCEEVLFRLPLHGLLASCVARASCAPVAPQTHRRLACVASWATLGITPSGAI
jgi:hypothetical protein